MLLVTLFACLFVYPFMSMYFLHCCTVLLPITAHFICRSESPTKSADPLSLPVAESDLTAGHFQTETTELTSRSENEQEYSRLHASNVRGRYRPTRGQGGRLYSGESSSASHFTPLRNPHGGLSSDRPQQKAFSGSKGSTGNETSLSVGGIRTAGFAMAPEKKQSGGSGIGGGSLRLTPQYNDSRPVKVVDDSLHWDDRAADVSVKCSLQHCVI